MTIIFLSNHDRTPMVTLPKDLAAIVFNEPYELPRKIERKAMPLAPEALKEYSGVYAAEWEKSWTFTVFLRGRRLFYTSTFPRETVELFFEGNDTFFVTPESADSFIFTRDNSGKIDGLKMYTLEGMYDKAVRVP